MDSVDCCFSFSRSRTRSRRNSATALGAACLALLLAIGGAGFALPPRASAQPVLGSRPARADSVHRSKPFYVMLRSAVIPGWGQAYNDKYLKAGIVLAGEGALAFQVLQERKRENQAVDREIAILQSGGDPTDPAFILAQNDEETHRNKKINWIWWGIAAHLLSMMDAYVDAHLATFDADFGPPQTAVDLGEKPRLTLAIRTRF
jgi:hypothetical protein